MKANEIREKYLRFFESREHTIIQPAKLIPEDDPTTLFTGSGMQMLLPFLLGAEHPAGKRLVDSQPCLRAQDIEDVGDNRHTTCFEMLGNWSLGDYFKETQIEWFFEFLTKEVGLNPEKIYVSCFIGDEDNNIPKDEEAAKIWQKLFKEAGVSNEIVEIGSAKDGDERGIREGERIFYYDDKENWWSRGGGIGSTPLGDPCGPDSEIFYDFGESAHDASFGKAHPASDSGRFIEIGNQVFMQYRRKEDGSFEPLKNKNVDFGGGLERIAAASIDTPDVFKTDLFWPIIEQLEQLSGKKYESNKAAMRVIADHIKGAVWLASQGLAPSNKEQGYVMRRLVRRAILSGLNLGIEQDFMDSIVRVISNVYGEYYPDIAKQEGIIVSVLAKEERVFRQTLKRGLKMLSKFADQVLTGKELFTLYDTYGFPIELSVEEAYRQEIKMSDSWRAEYDEEMNAQREKSRTATKGMFKGGLEDDSETTTKYHTATHLLLSALKKVLGDEVDQKGSNITADRIRFDFAWGEKLTNEQKSEIEGLVNKWIEADLPIENDEFDTDYAFDTLKSHGSFREKYGDKVTVYTIGDFDEPTSREICGGPHVKHTKELSEGGKVFKITKEESSSAGVRRIKAILADNN